MTAPEPIFLVTDFGTTDPYVGLMKSVIYQQKPYPPITDLTHHIPPQNEQIAAFLLEYCLNDLPTGSIVLVVVDPGVGTDRNILVLETTRSIKVVCPDTGIADGLSWNKVVRLDTEFHPNRASDTFHGKDFFAPAGRALSHGTPLTELGPEVERTSSESPVPTPEKDKNSVQGEVIYSDHFGNLITNIRSRDLPPGVKNLDNLRVYGEDFEIEKLSETYADGNGLTALIGSFDRVELAIPGGSADNSLKDGIGLSVTVSW